MPPPAPSAPPNRPDPAATSGAAPIEEVHWDGDAPATSRRPAGCTPAHRGGPARVRAARPRRPAGPAGRAGGAGALSLLAAFFAWVSAGPFWLAVGHAAGRHAW